MDEEFDISFDASDTDFSSDVDTTDVDYDTFIDVSDFGAVDTSYDSLDDISDDISDFDAESEEYDTLDDIPDMELDEMEYDTLGDIGEDMAESEFEESNFENLADEVSEDVLEMDLTEETSDVETDIGDNMDEIYSDDEYETLEDIPDSENEAGVESSDRVQDTSDLDSAVDRIMNSDLSPEHKKELLQNLRNEVSQEDANTEFNEDDTVNQPELYQETEEQGMDNFSDDDSPKVLKRDLTDEELAARDRDTEETLDNYRENLRNYGVDEETIEEFIDQERDKINAEYESLDNGDTSSNIYYMPTNWEDFANELINPEGVFDSTNVEQVAEAQDINDISGWLGDINPNFDEFDPESPYCNNCGSCAFAVYNRMNGDTDVCASAENIGYNDEMNALTGMEQVSMSPDEIESRLLAEGNGAHAIIGIDRAQGPGHWFNAACVDGKVVAIDGQTGEILDWPPDYGDVVNWEMSVKKEINNG